MIKIKDFGIDLDNHYELFFEHNGKEYKVALKDVCDALADQRFGFIKNNPTKGIIISSKKHGYSIALQEIKWNMLEQVISFEVEENNFALGEIVTYKDNFVEPFNVELR